MQCITDQVLKWMRELPPERAALLRAYHLEWWQGCALLSEIDQRIAMRTDHELEGWIECGHTLVEYCADLINDRWIGPEEFAALPEITQQRLAIAATANPDQVRARKLMPLEVFSRGMCDLLTFDDAVLAMMFCDRDLGDDLRWRDRQGRMEKRLNADGMLELQDITVCPEAMLFERTLEGAQGGSVRLEERTNYTMAMNPFDRERLWVYDTHGAYLGTAARRHRAGLLDQPAILRALGAAEHEKALLTAPLKERHADTTQLIQEIQDHNERVRSGGAVTVEDQKAERKAAKVAKQEAPLRREALANAAQTARELLDDDED